MANANPVTRAPAKKVEPKDPTKEGHGMSVTSEKVVELPNGTKVINS